jgi:hypothetical protein
MALRHRRAIWVTSRLITLVWTTAEAARRVVGTGVHLENWVDRIAARRGMDVLDVLAPLTERHSAAEEA